LAPYARMKKKIKLAKIAPNANEILWKPENCWDIDPIRIIVSRYTWGFKKVKIATSDIVGKRPLDSDISTSIVLLDLNAENNRIIPYPESQIADKTKRIEEYWLMKLFKKNDIPTTPILISRASETAQNKATYKTCCPRIPCLKTKVFWAPIAKIKENPRKKPVRKADNIMAN